MSRSLYEVDHLIMPEQRIFSKLLRIFCNHLITPLIDKKVSLFSDYIRRHRYLFYAYTKNDYSS
jgi:hypothetical protein